MASRSLLRDQYPIICRIMSTHTHIPSKHSLYSPQPLAISINPNKPGTLAECIRFQKQESYEKLHMALQNLARVTKLVYTRLGCKGAFKSIPDITQTAKAFRRGLHIDLYSISRLKQIRRILTTKLVSYIR